MNCSTCQKNVSLYIDGKVPDDIKNSMKTHLKECDGCRLVYSTQLLTGNVVNEEKNLTVNPFMSTRVMAGIEKMEQAPQLVFPKKRILQPVFVTLSVALALFIGVTAGNSFINTLDQETIPQELVYMNDAAMESLNLFIDE